MQNTLRQPPGTDHALTSASRLVADLVVWSTAAGLTTTPARIEAAVTSDALMNDRYYAITDALGLPPGPVAGNLCSHAGTGV